MSTTLSLPLLPGQGPRRRTEAILALVGNPNAGKTSLFNQLTGLRAKTANFPGTTVEHRRGTARFAERQVTVIDLPGLYSLEAVTPDERVALDVLEGRQRGAPQPDAVVFVADATNLERNLFLAGQVIQEGLPTVVALNMMDAARKQGLTFDVAELEARLGCRVVPISARTGDGLDALNGAIAATLRENLPPVVQPELSACGSCSGCQFAARYDWAESVTTATVRGDAAAHGHRTEAIDRVLTHRVVGLACFAGVMALVFMLIFWVAQYPMGLIDGLFGAASQMVGYWLPEGDWKSLISDGLIGGVGGMLVFLPQICLLFFVLALLEDSGYMARAAFVMDRLMHRVGLPGKAFVPLLSAHACAIPAIMSTRVIEDRRDRLATILVIPLMSCSARVPVYVMVVALLFPRDPLMAAATFAGAYALGIVAALAMAWVFKQTLLQGATRPLVIELPNYRRPSLRNALLLTYDRALAFVKTAGTTILVISLVLWALATYPKTPVEAMPAAVQAQVAQLQARGDDAGAENLIAQTQLAHSYAGQLGRAIEPAFAPLGLDWKMSVGVMTSFAAREVIVSTLGVLYGLGADAAEESPHSLIDSIRGSRHPDGTAVFTAATCLSLLVFYVLAMQCLPTQAVTRRETGSWKWPLVQLAYMTALAYTAALLTYQVAHAAGL
ncbi:MAG TPA: ferrous iron transport protein B [Lacipirellulaceae bacterium]|nr:ferrous iron transport protein B [Lacipirellulaceae bacterium]